jgi:hypothetical protein
MVLDNIIITLNKIEESMDKAQNLTFNSPDITKYQEIFNKLDSYVSFSDETSDVLITSEYVLIKLKEFDEYIKIPITTSVQIATLLERLS